MLIALAQLNPIVGDLQGNLSRVRKEVEAAARKGARLVVFPELAISGYPPKDLLLREGFVEACDRAIDQLAASLPTGVAALVGHPTHRSVPSGFAGNGASLLDQGAVQTTVVKCLLPNYDVFDERRYFLPASRAFCRDFEGIRLGIHICEDAWYGEPGTAYHLPPEVRDDPVAQLVADDAELLINLSASPFELDKPHRRLALLQRHVARHRRPFLFVNQVGGNDDLVFDGNSLVLAANGKELTRLPGFVEDLALVEFNPGGTLNAIARDDGRPLLPPAPPREADLLDALVLGLRDYMAKSGFRDCVLGLSGGIDSALAAYVAVQAVGPDRVHGLAMPSRYSSPHSLSDARALADNLGIDFEVIPIDAVHQAYEATAVIGGDLISQPAGLADQNLQARIRGASVMVRSNRYGWLALATGNKSEIAVGYCTLYGDMAGGFAVLADVFKKDVYAVSRHINTVKERREVIPVSSLTKAPSAELAPNQFDQDTLPPYPVLDAILEGLIEKEHSVARLSQQFPPETVRWVQTRMDRNEFKRRQMAPGIKLSARAFGTGRRMPMAARFDFETPNDR
ncbi:MAG TPA: NAD+ synthase [Planctomycetaceae bacterium]|nr:NAD+ synthase [Planctomycetaceae bacterium]